MQYIQLVNSSQIFIVQKLSWKSYSNEDYIKSLIFKRIVLGLNLFDSVVFMFLPISKIYILLLLKGNQDRPGSGGFRAPPGPNLHETNLDVGSLMCNLFALPLSPFFASLCRASSTRNYNLNTAVSFPINSIPHLSSIS